MDKLSRKRAVARDDISRRFWGDVKESPEDRQMLASTLALSDDPRMRDLAARYLSPSMKQHSLAKLIIDMSLSWRQVEAEYKSLMKSQGSIRQYRHMPDLMEQGAIDARSRYEPCHKCDQTGMFEKNTCPSCHGEKQIYVPGEVDRLRLMYETFGLIGKGGGLNVNLDLRKVNESEGLEDLYGSVNGILEGKVE